MKITALLPWGGSKRTLAARIIHQLGPHRCYWEPFCGSMAVLLAKELATMETVNDLHGDGRRGIMADLYRVALVTG